MIDEGSLERLTVRVQRAVERDRAFRSIDRHRDPLAAKCEHTDRERVPALHRRGAGKLLAAGNSRSSRRAVRSGPVSMRKSERPVTSRVGAVEVCAIVSVQAGTALPERPQRRNVARV
jgi:hypothetical protein